MEFVIENNSNIDSGFVPSLLFQNYDRTGTNDSGPAIGWKLESRLLNILKSYSEHFKSKAELKGCWNEKFQPFVYAVKTCQEDDFSRECCLFEEHVSTMKSFINLEDNWDSYGAESPNANSFTKTKKILDYLQVVDFPPTKLVPSVEGGISFLFIRGKKYADIECDNDGDMICGLSDRLNEPVIWQIGVDLNLFATIEKIREFFRK